VADRRRHAQERGAGVFGLSAGLLVFLLLLLFSVQLTYNLYARSQVTAVTYSAARVVAGYRSDDRRAAAAGEAEARLRRQLGRAGSSAIIEWDLDRADVVRLHVMLDVPAFAPAFVRAATGLDRIDRTIEVRVETPQ
jgi:hypothetical protein